MTREQVEVAYAEYQAGMRLDDVAHQNGVSYGSLHRHFRKYGLDIRARGAKIWKPTELFDDAGFIAAQAAWQAVPPHIKGAVAESRAAVWLCENGYDVWKPYSPHHRCDLGVVRDQRITRLQVKAASYNPARKYFHVGFNKWHHGNIGPYAEGEIDFFVVYCGGLAHPAFYVIPASEGIGRTSANLIPHRRKLVASKPLRWEIYFEAIHLLGAPGKDTVEG